MYSACCFNVFSQLSCFEKIIWSRSLGILFDIGSFAKFELSLPIQTNSFTTVLCGTIGKSFKLKGIFYHITDLFT